MMRVWMASVEPLLDKNIFTQKLSLVHPFRRERVLACRNEIDRCRSLAAGLLLRKAFLQLGFAYEQLEIRVGEYGKPQLDGGWYYNISHAGDYAAAVIAKVPVGIDIEEKKRFEKKEKLAKRFLAEQELAMYRLLDEVGKTDMLARTWTRKEAFSKADGKGMAIHFRTIDTLREDIFWSTEPMEGYWFSICAFSGDRDSMLRRFVENGKIEMEADLYV